MLGNGKKILVVTQHFFPESFRVNDLVKGFVEDGYAVDVLCGLPNYPTGEWSEGYSYFGPRQDACFGANVFRSGEIRRKGNSSIRIFLNYISWPFTASLKALRLRNGYDVVFCYNTSPVLMVLPALFASKVNKCRLVTYVLDIWPENLYSVVEVRPKFLRFIATWVSDKLYSSCDTLIGLSDSLVHALAVRMEKRGKDVAVLAIPQHCETLYEQRRSDSELEARFSHLDTIVFAGNLSPAQGLENVFDALSEAIHKKGMLDLHLLIVGDGMSRPFLEEYSKKLDIVSNVTFWGKVDPLEIPKFASVSKAMLVSFSDDPNLELTIPAKIASCMASEKPILGVMRGAGAEAILEAECGLVSNPGDSDALVANMVELCRMSEKQRHIMGANGFHYYRSHFSRRIVIDRLESALSS